MVNPDYAINFINTTVEIVATIFGFTIIFWIFWFENIGKNLKFDLGERLRGYTLLYFYNKFENTFFKNFLRGRMPIPYKNINYGYFFRKTKIGLLYIKFKNRTKNKVIQYRYKIVNYEIMAMFYVFSILSFYSVSILYDNLRLLWVITKIDTINLTKDPGLPYYVDKANDNFIGFIMLFSLFIIMVIGFSMSKYRKKKKRGSDIVDYIMLVNK